MKRIFIAIFLLFFSALPVQAKEGKETVYERIMRTGTIRCGYVVAEPALVRDPNTGSFSGITYELMQEIAKRLSLKLEMTAESSFGTMGEDLKKGQSDILCSAGWAYIPNARAHIITSTPLYYNAIGVYVRKNDNRFTSGLEAINEPSVTIAAIDGTGAVGMAREIFPKAKTFSMPQATAYEYNLLNVISGKADIAIEDEDYAERFLSKQKDKSVLINILKDNPLRHFAVGFILPMGEVELEQMINMSIEALHNEGFIEKLITKYEASPGSLIRVAPGYQISH